MEVCLHEGMGKKLKSLAPGQGPVVAPSVTTWSHTARHADEVQGAATAECREVPKSLAEKGCVFVPVHLARGHRKGAMMDRARPLA